MTTVTLRDGREVSSGSEEWRHECEARALLLITAYVVTRGGRQETLHGPDARRAALDAIQKIRGEEARKRLEAEMMAQWKAAKAAQQSGDAA